jgi:formamidopyrimidine-DNA glycosylase
LPELPEAERGRRLAERRLVGRTIVRARAADDRIVYKDVAPSTFARRLRGRRVLAARRYGKYMWLEVDRGPSPVFHFGMSGFFRSYRDPHERPTHWKFEFQTDDGRYFSMSDARRFGRIRLIRDPLHAEPISRLGFDPFLGLPSVAEMRRHLQGRKTPIKSVLLDQSFAAGVGNWIADEALYQARISPHRRAHALEANEITRLRNALRKIVTRAVEANADYHKFPRTWIFHYRWRDHRHRSEMSHKKCPVVLRYDRIGGRTTAWCPARQT